MGRTFVARQSIFYLIVLTFRKINGILSIDGNQDCKYKILDF